MLNFNCFFFCFFKSLDFPSWRLFAPTFLEGILTTHITKVSFCKPSLPCGALPACLLWWGLCKDCKFFCSLSLGANLTGRKTSGRSSSLVLLYTGSIKSHWDSAGTWPRKCGGTVMSGSGGKRFWKPHVVNAVKNTFLYCPPELWSELQSSLVWLFNQCQTNRRLSFQVLLAAGAGQKDNLPQAGKNNPPSNSQPTPRHHQVGLAQKKKKLKVDQKEEFQAPLEAFGSWVWSYWELMNKSHLWLLMTVKANAVESHFGLLFKDLW